MTSLRIGVITEDKTDADTLRVFIQRLRGGEVSVKARFGRGCGEILRKGERYMHELVHDGCRRLILVRDLDRDARNGQLNNADVWRRELEEIPVPAGALRHICIPIEELEAWFWADEAVLKKVGRGTAFKMPASPEGLAKPKEALMRLSRAGGNRPRYATTDNPDLAKSLDLDLCARRCAAFRALREFVLSP